MLARSFESHPPTELGPIQEFPNNPFEGDLILPVKIAVDAECKVTDIENRSKHELNDEQTALLGAFAVRMRQHMISTYPELYSRDTPTLHDIRARNAGKNFTPFVHIDNQDLNSDFFEQLEKHGPNGFYTFVTDRDAPVWFEGEFSVFPKIKGFTLPAIANPMLQAQTIGREPKPLKPDTMYQLGYSTVHRAAKGVRKTDGLFIGGHGTSETKKQQASRQRPAL